MTFLNPIVLFGLAAAAIPILIHLLNKRKLRTIDFSTLTFLKELQKNKMRKITIRQWLLLILRTLIILFLVLAFSRPALKGNIGTIGSHAKTTIVIVIDNTASMGLHNHRGVFLDQAKEQAVKIISLMQENDEAVVLRLSDLPGLTMDRATHEREKLHSIVNGTEISLKQRSIAEALRVTSSMLQQSKNANKEVYILSDGQRSSLVSAKSNGNVPENLFSQGTRFFFTPFSETRSENIGIEQIVIPPTLLQVNKPVQINTVIKNYGTVSVKNHLVSITVGEVRVMQKSVSLEAGESRTVDFSITPLQARFLTGSIELEDDAFESDNKRYFSFYIPKQIHITLVPSDDRHSGYIMAALNVTNTLSHSGSVSVNRVTASQVSSTMLASTDVVILSGVTDLSESLSRMVHLYVTRGGSLIFFPSDDTTGNGYRFMEQFSITIAGRIIAPSNAPFQFDNIDFDFPIFHGMFDESNKKNWTPETPEVSAVLNIVPTKIIRHIISLSNGSPFLWQREIQNGKVIGFSVPATQQWSNFVLKGIFVPILNQSVLYLTSHVQPGPHSSGYRTGENLEFSSSEIRRSKQKPFTSVNLVDPEERISPLESYSKTMSDRVSQTIFSGPELQTSGQYFILADRDTILAVSVNIDESESDGILATTDEIAELFHSVGVEKNSLNIFPPHSSLQEIVLQSRFGTELWKYFLVLAVLLGLSEMMLAREKSERSNK